MGTGSDGEPVFLRDIWPTAEEVRETVGASITPELFSTTYAKVFEGDERWRTLPVPAGGTFEWDPESTYVRRPPFFEGLEPEPAPIGDITGARALAVLGDSVNYSIGHFIGPRAFRPHETKLGRWLKPEYLDRTHRFYEKYGGFTIIIGRFVPIVRTFAPFLAGVGAMTYRKFLAYNMIGAAAWVAMLVYAGYLFGNIPWVKDNLAYIVVAIVIVSILPMGAQFLRERRARNRAARQSLPPDRVKNPAADDARD